MAIAFTGLGSNIDPEPNIRGGIGALRQEFDDLRCSPVYQTEPVGFTGPPFYNLVVRFATGRSLADVVAALREIEDRFGRERSREGFGNRTLDLDLLLFDDVVCNDPVLLPRPDIREYPFVARPLAELEPDGRHPELGETFAEVWAGFPAGSDAGMRRVDLDLGC